jgi:hypothetical protein
MKEDLLKIIEHFGEKSQREYLALEYQELQDEIYKLLNGETEDILTEITDVLVITLQFMAKANYSFDILEKNVKRELNFKIKRTLERIESGYYEKQSDNS